MMGALLRLREVARPAYGTILGNGTAGGEAAERRTCMNIQIFGTKKSFDTKKAQRYFKERRVKFQFIDLKEKGMSKGELESVARAAGGIDALVDPKAKDADTVALFTYLSADQKFDKLLENQHIVKEPIVRNGRQATVGYAPDTWKTWE